MAELGHNKVKARRVHDVQGTPTRPRRAKAGTERGGESFGVNEGLKRTARDWAAERVRHN